MQTTAQALAKLDRSRFRSGFRLSTAEYLYVYTKGTLVVRKHAQAFVRQKLAPARPKNDGRQTPWEGHPVFKAMHGTGFCCRGCMEKWYKVPKGVPLPEELQERIVNFLMVWIEREVRRKTGSSWE